MNIRKLVTSAVLVGCASMVAGGTGFAQGKGQGRGGTGQGQQGSSDQQGKDQQGKGQQGKDTQNKDTQNKDTQNKDKPASALRAEIGQKDRDAIARYFKDNTAGLPPGLAKRGADLPPGLEKQLQKNGKLPPGLEKKLEPVPAPLERQLGGLPDGYSRRVLGQHLIVVNEKTKQIGDVFLNVVR
ncbi:MAG TPA: hypothetical protein VFO58_10605 [Vicinamibacterales bacterium]|nr:hypothetical protein [Vicinamibacterales bacterium]